ncbi:MAG: RecQ family ATP-dependent DNA helicase [Crocinitomicaceae bacterium]|nr:RecQ family ATP-dependent DNA helicase [Crocinitomicaceae bacterium]
MERSREILLKHWGHESFRPLQEEIVDGIIYGHDTLAILPTGGGKSVCFQVPAMALDGITLVVSPLIALMQDQVDQLTAKGIKAQLITSTLSYREIDIALDNCRFGGVKFLYTSPERLKSELFLERFKEMPVSLIVVDEAHCISEWGHDFRPAYREISTIRELHPEVPVAAFTASATAKTKEDIAEYLALKSPKEYSAPLNRDNLSYHVRASQNKLGSIIDYCQNRGQETGIVYCQTRKSVKEVVRQLRAKNINAGFYHGGLSAEDRAYMLTNWMKDKIKIMVATNAFGMGIDKSNVRFVLHFEIPNTLEAYYQEAGRAGRDGAYAEAIAFWEEKDLTTMQQQLDAKYPSKERIKQIYSSVCNFLKIAIGSGENETYPFDLRAFTKSFSFSITEVYHALKILQTNGDLFFSESNFQPTRLKYSIGSSALYKFQVGHDSVAKLITLLSRSHSGIFDHFVSIHESEMAKRLSINTTELTRQLEHLEQYGVIDINFRTSLPKISLLHERLPDNYLKLDFSIYEQRRDLENSKLASMVDYIQSSGCRTQLISKYFGSEVDKCGNCDRCREEANSNHSYEELIELIPTLLPATLDTLVNRLSIKRDMIERAIRQLMLEEMIHFEEGEYRN